MRTAALSLRILPLVALLFAGGLACDRKTVDLRDEVPVASSLRSFVASLDGRVELEWVENRDPNFAAYELRRSDRMPVTRESTLVFQTSDRVARRHLDATPKIAKIYYYRVYVINDRGVAAGGNDVVVRIPVATDPGILGHITEDTVWDLATSPVVVKGDLTVMPGVTLSVMPGVEVRFLSRDALESGRDPRRAELIVRGTLRAVGENGRPVRFVSGSAILERDGWGGIWFDRSSGGSNNRIERAVIRHATTALRLDGGELSLYNARIEACGEGAVDLSAARLSAANLIVSDIGAPSADPPAAYGLRAGSSSALFLANSLVANIRGAGIVLSGDPSSVRNNLVGWCAGAGLAADERLLSAFANNLVYECRTGVARLTADGSGARADHNGYWHMARTGYTIYEGTAAGPNDRLDMPEFVAPDWNEPQRGDFSLKSGSSLSRAGESGSTLGPGSPLTLGVLPQ